VIGASVDLGSNSVHLLVAGIVGHRLEPVVDESEFLGLGDVVDADGALGSAGRERLAATLRRYADVARGAGATDITFVGTEPIRRAADAPRIVADVELASGVPLHVLSHEEEAYLTLVGVTEGRPVDHETLVVDIGGGSSEFCAVTREGPPRAAGLPIGSNRLTAAFGRTDPPTEDALAAMADAADAELADALPADPAELVVVGGTASNLLKAMPGGERDPMLTRGRTSAALVTLTSAPSARVAERFGLKPTRARILPAGAVIIAALLRRYRMEGARVSEASLREGAIHVVHHAGRAWRDQLPALAHGWRD
jgi:exopolyphosphatase/guanosine-5'-triphosphate,3'-diphosphate pyrophosphatase